ncbi:hypothetical protein LZ012_04635 [Dechloromonas sp. XY25]|uniref:Glycosyltransferase n=1 Tax=Dechloromonas hankyongensis TaxID=2908002 RepID=A0ABS9JZH3_9RHOO|nr:hypothetical protein [Dechloromonas hankyongensis]MCG2576276.1 hypothetical protein [Dechloromonas hankyongensis]
MQQVLPSGYLPLVSIIVPITDDAHESGRRMDLARAQTWHGLEVIPVQVQGATGIAQAVNVGLSACKGDFISLLLPGASYAPDKIAMQVAFAVQFDLQEAVVFCNYTIVDSRLEGGQLITLPSVDPASMFRKIYCGLPIDCSTLLVSRKALTDLGGLDERCGVAALHGFVLALSQHADMVGMAANLVCCTRQAHFTGAEKSCLRVLYKELLSDLVRSSKGDVYDADVFSVLGEAAAARLEQRLPLAAWDAWCAARKLQGQSGDGRRALSSFAKPLLRSTWRRLPVWLKHLLRTILPSQAENVSSRLDFSAIYRDNGFVGTESLSGAGSTSFQTRVIRQKLPALFRELGVKSVLDIPCGDFHWMRNVDLSGIYYTGADVVEDMVRKNQQLFGGPLRAFECVNLITGPLPVADLVFCRDCLVHLPFEDALAAIETIRQSKCQWLLTTTFTRDTPNADLDAAGWRALNLTLPPFNLPQPALLISEKCTEAGGLAGDKSLGLWRIADLQTLELA